MGKGDDTRDRILSFALARTARSGLNSVTVGSSASDLGMSKSGFFAHFGSKEALQVAVIERAIDRFRLKVVEPALRHSKPRQRLDALLDGYIAWMVGDDELAGCPFVLVSQEVRDCPGPVRDALVNAQESWRALLTATISAAKEDASIARHAPSAQIAFELIGAILSYQFAHAVLREDGSSLRVSAAISHVLDKE